jgi:DNA-binding NarL/FixJ family response regulator
MTATTDRATVLVLASEPLRAAGLTAMLRAAPHLSVRPFSPNVHGDVVVADLNEVAEETVRPLVQAHARHGSVGILITDRYDVDAGALAAASVRRVIHPHEVSRGSIHAAVGEVRAPHHQSPDLVQQIRRIRDAAMSNQSRPQLTERELAVLSHLAQGSDTADVVKALHLSERTVKYVLRGIMNRFGLRNRVHAVAFAIRAGYL